jgi:cytochrome c-type biogenesis protein CcmH
MPSVDFRLRNRRSRNFNFCLFHFSFCTLLTLFLVLSSMPSAIPAEPVDLEEQAQKIASELRCPVCQNLSTGDSPSELAQEMRQIILSQLQEGKTPEQIKAYFVSKYGQWVLLAPRPQGFNLVLWILPFVGAGAGVVLVLFTIRHQSKNKRKGALTASSELPLEATPASLAEEKIKLSTELEELDFDFHSGRLSEADHRELRKEVEARAVEVRKKADSLPPSPPPTSQGAIANSPIRTARKAKEIGPTTGKRNWQLVSGALFLLLFGITLGVLLSNSLRPRESTQDTLTGDFLTGTGPGGIATSSGNDLDSFLAQGRSAFERHEWPQAIESFKKALAIDPNHPEAHSYMGFILAQAGHPEGALLAFDRALSSNPEFPAALWGKGMLLYRVKQDFSGARQTLEKLLHIMPTGAERNEVQKTIIELSQLAGQEKKGGSRTESNRESSALVRGIISIDPKLKVQGNGQAVLFIIARSANSSGGPPLAVQRINQPKFPVSYSLGAENVMIPGTPFSGKVSITARLDKDGNPTTREPGNLIGEYKKNPVTVGAEKIDIVLDQVM